MQDRSSKIMEAARERVLASVRTLYFPEIWYILESFFLTAKERRVLEVGYGIGMVAQALAKSGWQTAVVDPSPPALGDLRERFEAAGLPGVFETTEADTLPYPPHSFEFVVCINTLEFTNDPNGVVREIARVLKPGGKAVVATFNKRSPWGLSTVARAVRKDGAQRSARCMTKPEFARLFKNNRLHVVEIKDRAAYLPGTTRLSKLPLPLTGAFVALVLKPVRRSRSKSDAPAVVEPAATPAPPQPQRSPVLDEPIAESTKSGAFADDGEDATAVARLVAPRSTSDDTDIDDLPPRSDTGSTLGSTGTGTGTGTDARGRSGKRSRGTSSGKSEFGDTSEPSRGDTTSGRGRRTGGTSKSRRKPKGDGR
jgi:SAM-dependent methyltransferase